MQKTGLQGQGKQPNFGGQAISVEQIQEALGHQKSASEEVSETQNASVARNIHYQNSLSGILSNVVQS